MRSGYVMRSTNVSGMMLLLGAVTAAAVVAACGSEDVNPGSPRTGPGSAPPADPAADGINATGAGAGSGAVTGLPCDVQQLLENRCIGCHLGASPPALLTYDDLMKPSSTPGQTLAQQSLARMKSTTSPMPPAPAVAPAPEEIAVFEAWITAGTPRGTTCTPPAGSAADAGANVYNTPTVCTSNATWTGGDRESPLMHPGGVCITCHTMRGGPAYTIAGTVFPTAHEPNDCNGVSGAVTVVVTDKNGVVTNIPVNTVGNFYLRATIAAPFHVKVQNGAKERAMAGTLTAGDCNSCHTVAGVNGAPGRIMAP